MTPLQIDILFWYQGRGTDYRDGDFSAPAVRSEMDAFRGELGLLEAFTAASPGDYRSYRLTPRGQAYVDYIQSVPLPMCRWEIPEPSDV